MYAAALGVEMTPHLRRFGKAHRRICANRRLHLGFLPCPPSLRRRRRRRRQVR